MQFVDRGHERQICQKTLSIHEHLKFKGSSEVNNTVIYWKSGTVTYSGIGLD